MNFTDDQKKIIDARGCSILVSAAAGSGKTAVLVERIIRLIGEEHEDGSERTDIDRMLIVTFTKAAAAQMREKITSAIEKKLAENPTDTHLQRQSALIANAQITTIDSFCLYVLRNNFSDVDIDPGFRIADEGEIKLLKKDVLSDVIEECYETGDPAFMHMAECISSSAEDTAIESTVLKLYEAAMSNPWPEEWLRVHGRDYAVSGGRLGGEWYRGMVENILEQLRACIAGAKNACSICLLSVGPYMYSDQVEDDLEQFERACARINDDPQMDYDTLSSIIGGISYKTLSRKSDDTVDAGLRERVKNIRDKYKAGIKTLMTKYFFQTESVHLAHMEVCDEILGTLTSVTLLFKQRLDEAMRKKGILSFADCEHLALNVLVQRTDEGYEFTQTAAQYRKYYDYVMIDEYQDSNQIQELLLSAVSGESEDVYNRFMVGDVKQSIYRFRKADPKIFMDRYAEYDQKAGDDGTRLLVDLHQNFRSRTQVLDSVNSVCEALMSKNVGDVTYDDRAALHPGAVYREDAGNDFETEFLVYDRKNEDGLDAREVEARGIALRIEQLMSSSVMVREGDDPEKVRKLRYGDIVILLRKASGNAEIFSKVLAERGIPVHVSGIAGYFDTYEIKTLLQLLKIIVNPLQDISFYGVMSSVIGGFDASEIARLRVIYSSETEGSDGAYLYDACRYIAASEKEYALKDKAASFVRMLEKYRAHSEYMGAEELLCEILRDTDYRAVMYAMKDGEKRLANIDMLMKKASDYAETSYFGLYNFLRYIDMVKKYEVSIPESETIDEGADVVRIMTIHKSKGLEFPVCFVSGLGGKFNDDDYTGPIVIDSEAGVGMYYIDDRRRIRCENLRRSIIADRIKWAAVSEELRVLYVAMTRAKEKLILTGVSDDVRKKLTTLESGVSEGKVMPSIIRSEFNYLSWILLAMLKNGYGEAAIGYIDACCNEELTDPASEDGEEQEPQAVPPLDIPELHMSFAYYPEGERALQETEAAVDRHLLKEQLANLVSGIQTDTETPVIEYLKKLYEDDYSHHELDGLITKVSVSDLKHAANEERNEGTVDAVPDRDTVEPPMFDSDRFREPRFISNEERVSGATVRGSAFHRAMELMDFTYILEDIPEGEAGRNSIKKKLAESLDLFTEKGQMSKSQREIFGDRALQQLSGMFLQDTAVRMAAAAKNGLLYREAPFMLGIPAAEYNPDFPENENVLIQGIIDVYWEEDDGVVILDYKTDRVSDASELKERYQVQLDWYAKALEAMHMHVKEKLIYSFALDEIIVL